MQLETGKSKHGLVGTLRAIIKEEGCVIVIPRLGFDSNPSPELAGYIEVSPPFGKKRKTEAN